VIYLLVGTSCSVVIAGGHVGLDGLGGGCVLAWECDDLAWGCVGPVLGYVGLVWVSLYFAAWA
jgi:hypothetical protein